MGEWLAQNWLPLLIVILAVIGTIFFLIKKKGLRQAAIDAIVWAEQEFNGEAGQQKMQEAIDYIQQIVPFLKFVPDKIIKSFIQGVFNQIKKALDLQVDKIEVTEVTEDKIEENVDISTNEG